MEILIRSVNESRISTEIIEQSNFEIEKDIYE
jgi:hypothetical protein